MHTKMATKAGRGLVYKRGGRTELIDGRPVGREATRYKATLEQGQPALEEQAPGSQLYLMVPSLVAPREVRRAAERIAAHATEELGLRPHQVVWFVEATPAARVSYGEPYVWNSFRGQPGTLGCYDVDHPGNLFVRLTDDVRLAVEIAAHEARHAAQYAGGARPGSPVEREQWEQEALEYGQAALAWWDESGGDTWAA